MSTNEIKPATARATTLLTVAENNMRVGQLRQARESIVKAGEALQRDSQDPALLEKLARQSDALERAADKLGIDHSRATAVAVMTRERAAVLSADRSAQCQTMAQLAGELIAKAQTGGPQLTTSSGAAIFARPGENVTGVITRWEAELESYHQSPAVGVVEAARDLNSKVNKRLDAARLRVECSAAPQETPEIVARFTTGKMAELPPAAQQWVAFERLGHPTEISRYTQHLFDTAQDKHAVVENILFMADNCLVRAGTERSWLKVHQELLDKLEGGPA